MRIIQKHFGVTQAPRNVVNLFSCASILLLFINRKKKTQMPSRLERPIYLDPDRASLLIASSCGFEEVFVNAHT